MDNNQQRSKESLVEELQQLHHKVSTLEALIDDHKSVQVLQSALYRIADTASSTEDMQSFYRTLHDIVNGLTSAKNFYIALYQPDKDSVSFPYYKDDEDDEMEENDPNELTPLEQFKKTLTGVIFRDGQTVHADNARLKEMSDSGEITVIGRTAEDWLGVPLKQDKNVLGALVIQSYQPEFRYSRRDEELLVYVSRHIATALQRKQDAESLQKAHHELQHVNKQLEQNASELELTNVKLEAMLEERRSIQEKLVYDAFHDVLTNLPNRALFVNRLEHALKRTRRRGAVSFAVFFLDLDRFKVINDSLGHLVGDALLQQVSQRLLDSVRPGDTVARLGGDEFCVLLDNIGAQKYAIEVAERMLEKLATPFVIDERQIFTSASIGITLSSIGYDNPEDMLRDSDAAMYQAKSHGKACFQIFDKTMYKKAITRLQLEQDLRHSISNGELLVHYQPIVDLRNNKIVSFEALARWKHKTLGYIKPREFISIAEETGFIKELGTYVLEQAMTQANLWRTELEAADDLCISVNLSKHQVAQKDMADTIKSIAKSSQLPIECLRLEIAETALLNNVEVSKVLLAELKNMRVQLVLDDFGMGYSSLGHLHHFPLSALKIDLSFIKSIDKDTDRDNQNHAVIGTIQALAASLELDMVAEGIETEAHCEVVKSLNVAYGQGDYFGAPMPADKVVKLLSASEVAEV